MKLSHDDLARSLADHLLAAQDSPMVWTDMQLGPSGSPRPDVYAIPKTYTALRPMIYEVKVSVSDFRADVTAGKWQSYRPMCSGIYFAFPDGLAIAPDDVPAECGIIRRNAETGKWRAARKPVLRPIDSLPVKVWQKLLIDGVGRTHEAHQKQVASEHHMLQRLRQRFGAEVADYLRDASAAREKLEQIKDGTQWEIVQARERAERAVKDSREVARRELDFERQSFDRGVAGMRKVLGMPDDADTRDVAERMRQAVALLSGDMHAIERARTQLTAANDALASVTELVGSISKTQGVQHA